MAKTFNTQFVSEKNSDTGEYDSFPAIKGKDGIDGKSAYEIAVTHGFTGTEEEWIQSLKGKDGVPSVDDVARERLDKLENAADGTITGQLSESIAEKQDRFRVGKNLFNKDSANIIKGKYLDTYGQLMDSSVGEISEYIKVKANTTYTLTTTTSEASASGYCHCFYDYNKNFISSIQNTPSVLTFVTDEDCEYIRICTRERNDTETQLEEGATATAHEPFIKIDIVADIEKELSNLYKTVSNDNAVLSDVTDKYYNLYNPNDPDVKRGYFLEPNGQERVSSTGVLSYSGKIAVEVGKKYSFGYLGNSARTYARFVTAYTDENVAISASGADSVTSWVCPDGISYIKVTFYNDTDGFMVNEGDAKPFVPFGNYIKYDSIEYGKVEEAINNAILENQKKSRPPFRTEERSTLSNGDALYLRETAVKTNKNLIFVADIESFSSIAIGHGKTEYSAYYAVIDSSNVTVKSYTGATVGTYPHGLDIKNNIQVQISKTHEQSAKIRIVSNGNLFETTTEWMGDNGRPFVESINSNLKNCKLTWMSQNFNSDIWLFGDSYFGISNPARWIYYLLQDGHSDFLISGFGGRNSENAYFDFAYLLKNGKPKKVIWCLGMNDNDSSTAVNGTWLNRFHSVETKCREEGIELILATIPNAVGGNVDDNPDASLRQNKYKNAIVKESGYRYIDFAKSVGAQENGTWYEGMLSSDGVHPTASGAKALYMQALVDVPELMM